MADKPPLFRVRSLGSCLGLLLFVLVGLAILFGLAGRKTPDAWRTKLTNAGVPLTVEAVRAKVPDEQNAALLWAAFEQRHATGDPVFLRGREIPRDLYEAAFRATESPGGSDPELVEWTLARSAQALRQGAPSEADRTLLRIGLELLEGDLDQLDDLLGRSDWAFGDKRSVWDPRKRAPRMPFLSDRNPCRIVGLGPRVELLELAVEWSSVRALLAAEEGDAEGTAHSLLVARHLLDAIHSEPFAPEFAAALILEARFQEALGRALPQLTATADALELERRLANLDFYLELADVFRTRRVEMLEWFEREPGTPVHIGDGWKRKAHWFLFGHDVQSVASAFEECITALEGPKFEALRVFWGYLFESTDEWEWIAPSVVLLGGHEIGFPDVIHQILDLQTRNDLLRIGLADRLHGREAAQALAAACTDLAKGQPLKHATDPDGTERYWSIGTDWRDDNGGGDDLEVILPPLTD